MKPLKCLIPAAVVMLLLVAATVHAQGTPNSDTFTATYIDNQTHTIPGNTVYWFRFNYGGDNSMITVTLVDGAGTNQRFDVFTPAQVEDLTNEIPIGRGTVFSTNCNFGAPLVTGGCQGDDLVWMGKFPAQGTYYVELFNDNPNAANFTLTVAGESVTPCIQPGQPPVGAAPLCASFPGDSNPALPTIAPVVPTPISATPLPPSGPPSTAPNTFYTDPYHSLPFNNQPHVIAPGATIWYRFEYAGDGSDIVLRLVDGLYKNLEFGLYTPEQAKIWYSEPPIGRGTVSACGKNKLDNPELNCGPNANDMLWSGKFFSNGTYFVQLTNPTGSPVDYLLTVSGTGVSLCTPNGQLVGSPDVSIQGPAFLPCPQQ